MLKGEGGGVLAELAETRQSQDGRCVAERSVVLFSMVCEGSVVKVAGRCGVVVLSRWVSGSSSSSTAEAPPRRGALRLSTRALRITR